ncbi:transposase, partial [Halomonas sp.]|uniref:transposase n=1 Tax=Halomonas sp. TaxID=1486246 RepID=UPI00298EA070
VGVDETASRRGQRYVTVFLDMRRKQEPVIFAVPGHGKDTIKAFSAFLAAHGGDPDNVIEVVCDMSQAFLSGVAEHLPEAEVTVDWFHIVQTFTKRLDEVCKKARREQGHPKSLRWALLKSLENKNLTPKQLAALQELVADLSATSDAWVIKEKLRWIQKAPTLERHADAVVRRWLSGLTNARLEGMNGLFQAARSRARGYRSEANFIAMIYLIGSPVGRLFDQAKST